MKEQKFINLTQLKYKLFDFVHWYNNIRIHGSLNYLIPVEFRKTIVHIKSVIKGLPIHFQKVRYLKSYFIRKYYTILQIIKVLVIISFVI
ncbi:IS3 family transposase [Spiroplasma endosymbiont of Polydrusus formosus]|uniref:IS3 family transposase n=1 Tax=Spiroplasma endosymbiont of Polydrusus formosus TaxID=3139326 RepID=UPI0035B51926